MLSQSCAAFAVTALLCAAPVVLPAQPKPAEGPSAAATAAGKAAKPDYSKEGIVFNRIESGFDYNADGTGTRSLAVEARVQSDAAVHQYGVLSFDYAAGNEHVTIEYLRVRKPDGTVVDTPASDAQDMPTAVTRAAPFYNDLKELQVPVKSLSAGDTLEYRIRFDTTKPEAPGHFWGSSDWIKSNVALRESVELSYPKGTYVQVVSPGDKPVVSEKDGRTVYVWQYAHPEPSSGQPAAADPDAMPDIAWTTFHNWQEIGDWYGGLTKDRVVVTPEIQAKVNELLQGKTTDDEKIQAIYHYVALEVRYIGVDFGIGRYQPHAAEAVLDNQYGDCKDKDTLLQAMLKAAGYDAWPALIGSAHKLHPELPSPAQFDHVITVVPRGASVIWLDSTPEVAPWKMLLFPIRDKQALVIPTTGEPKLMRTPADGPFPFAIHYTATATLDSDGTLTGHLDFSLRGDEEVAFRTVYRSTPRAQWDQVAQNISQAMGYAGTVSHVDVSLPDETDQPFHFAYDYDRKEYADWANHRILPLMTGITLPAPGDSAKAIQVGGRHVEIFHSEIKLPAQYTAVVPKAVEYTTPFATYTTTYKLDGHTLIADRRFQVLEPGVPAAEWDQYKKFADNVNGDVWTYIQLVAAGGPMPDMTPSNPDAVSLIQAAWAEINNHNANAARSDLASAEQLNPRERGLWAEYGMVDLFENRMDDAQADLRKEIQYHPDNLQTYRFLAELEVRMKKTDDAMGTLRDLLKVAPDDVPSEIRLGSLLILEKKYDEAATLLEAAAKKTPANRTVAVQAGQADLLAGKRDAGHELLRQALDGATDPGVLNDASYELANAGLDLPLAESSCRKAVDALEKQTAGITLTSLSHGNIADVQLLAASWDTMGWIYFREGKEDLAESYVHASWVTSQQSEVGDHLAQIYEKEGRLQDAANVYALADAAETLSPQGPSKEAMDAREKALNAKGYRAKYPDAGGELGKQRSIPLPKLTKTFASADFFVLLSAGKVEDIRFIRGDDRLQSAADALRKADYGTEFPTGSTAKLVRRGILACSGVTDSCQFTLLLPQSVALN